MASSSSAAAVASCSSSRPKWQYDVFLSYRGKDTRNTFTSHLYNGLDRVGLRTFLDDRRLEEGSTISVELCNAIEESQVAVIIFSQNYASSSWCLDELVKIMECKNEPGKTVIPVFYDVDPSTVRYQKESFAEAFAKHESRFNQVDDVQGKHKVQGWKTALTDAAGLKGHDIRDRNEAECIQIIVAQISKLCNPPPSSLKDIVGLNFHLEQVKPLLNIEINDVRIVGIWGMGGVGKTTIARAIFETFSDQFKASCFLSDVKEIERRDGLHSLQNILFSKLLSKDCERVDNIYDGEHIMSNRLSSKKVLIVLDDIDHRDHLTYLAGDCGWFGKGSRIVVTSRDKQLIGQVDAIYEVPTLREHEAFQLFNQHAFKDKVTDRRFESLSWEVVNHAKGLPLALVVWGSFLNNRDIDQWRSALKRMKDCSNSKIVEKLKISYDGLESQEQRIFLDIACFFRGDTKDDVVQILESCGFQAIIGLDVLIEKSLVFIFGDIYIEMHDLIQDMGKHVIELKKTSQGEYSRIWRNEDFERVMSNNTGTEAVEAIQIYLQSNFQLSKKAMKNMNNLRYLRIHGWPMTLEGGSIKYLSSSLCWFDWESYPAESLPAKFEPKKLVHLRLRNSKLRRLWTGQKDLPNLRTLDLSWSEQLEQTPDFTKMKNLEILRLGHCTSLAELPHSLRYCRNLSVLDLSDCKKLESLPEEIGDLDNLRELDANRCTAISQPHSSIVRLNKLEYLCFRGRQNSELAYVFPRVNEGLRSLTELDLGYCNLIDGGLPDDIGSLSSLQVLHLRGNNFEHLPQSIVSLIALRILDLGYCTKLKKLPEIPPNIVYLCANYHLAKGSIQILATKSMKLQLITFTSLRDDDVDFTYYESDDESYYDEMNDLLAETLSGYINALSASDSLLQRMITQIRHPGTSIPSLFDLEEVKPCTANECRFKLPKDWYVRGNFFGFALCLVGIFRDVISIDALTLLSDDESEAKSVALNFECDYSRAYFLFVPFNSIWDASKGNGKTPNDYGLLKLDIVRINLFKRESLCIRGHLIYKKAVGIGKRRSRSYVGGESCSKIQRYEVESPIASETLQLFPEFSVLN